MHPNNWRPRQRIPCLLGGHLTYILFESIGRDEDVNLLGISNDLIDQCGGLTIGGNLGNLQMVPEPIFLNVARVQGGRRLIKGVRRRGRKRRREVHNVEVQGGLIRLEPELLTEGVDPFQTTQGRRGVARDTERVYLAFWIRRFVKKQPVDGYFFGARTGLFGTRACFCFA